MLLSRDPAFRAFVPASLILFCGLSLLDLAFTKSILQIGGYEANPVMRWFWEQGLFEFAKIATTLLVCCIAFSLWPRRAAVRAMACANVAFSALLAYHIANWALILCRESA
jgi:hypothetical protein